MQTKTMVLLGVLMGTGILAEPTQAQVTLGAMGGLNLADISGDPPVEGASYGSSTSFGFGIIGEFHLTSGVWLSVQPMYLQRGSTIQFEFEDMDEPQDSVNVALNYFTVPVLAKITAANQKVFVTGGVNFGFLGSATATTVGGKEESDIKDSVRDFDVAFDFGVGVQLPVGKPRILIEARYEQSLVNLADLGESANPGLPTRFRSSGLQLWAGILLPLGGGS